MASVSLSVLRNRFRSFHAVATRFSSNFNGYRPRRSLLYVPGNETKKVVKAAGLKADVVVLDCEDGVAQSAKACYFICLFFLSIIFPYHSSHDTCLIFFFLAKAPLFIHKFLYYTSMLLTR